MPGPPAAPWHIGATVKIGGEKARLKLGRIMKWQYVRARFGLGQYEYLVSSLRRKYTGVNLSPLQG